MILYVMQKAASFAYKEFERKHFSHYLCTYIFECVFLGYVCQERMGSWGLLYSFLRSNNVLYYVLYLAIYHLLFSTSNSGTYSAKRPKRQKLKRRTSGPRLILSSHMFLVVCSVRFSGSFHCLHAAATLCSTLGASSFPDNHSLRLCHHLSSDPRACAVMASHPLLPVLSA